MHMSNVCSTLWMNCVCSGRMLLCDNSTSIWPVRTVYKSTKLFPSQTQHQVAERTWQLVHNASVRRAVSISRPHIPAARPKKTWGAPEIHSVEKVSSQERPTKTASASRTLSSWQLVSACGSDWSTPKEGLWSQILGHTHLQSHRWESFLQQ